MKHECVEERNRDKIGECNSFYSPFNAMCMYLCWLCMHLSRSECWKSSSNSFTTSRTQIKSERIKLRCHTSISSEVYVKCWCKIHTCNFSLEVDILKIVCFCSSSIHLFDYIFKVNIWWKTNFIRTNITAT